MNRDNVAISKDWEARINLATVIARHVVPWQSLRAALHSSCLNIYPEIWRPFKIGLPFLV